MNRLVAEYVLGHERLPESARDFCDSVSVHHVALLGYARRDCVVESVTDADLVGASR